ncbi:hypothetical protein TWF481_011694 [Arthrobotrys musiformis]|uniref:F-box domain-containing protein n=1 Tax=Arthrobotrys musiformis TaxID=47236 RepID=A0AAV9W0Y2_9PEZI
MASTILTNGGQLPSDILSLTTIPQEILLEITKQLCILDVFVLRRSCKALYSRLSGEYNQALYYYFLNNPSISSQSKESNKKRRKRRFSHFDKDKNYFEITKDILSGRTEGCGICLSQVPDGGFMAYKGRVLYKRVCQPCAQSYFTELWRLEDEHPNLKIHPNQRITWDSASCDFGPFEDTRYTHGLWIDTLPKDCVLNTDLQSAVSAQSNALRTSSPYGNQNLGKQAWHSRYDKQISFALQKKEAADVVVRILTEEYTNNYTKLHWLKSPQAFEEYVYNSLLWVLRPWLAPYYGDKSKGLPRFSLGDRVDEILELYAGSEELAQVLRIKGIRNASKQVLEGELGRIPNSNNNNNHNNGKRNGRRCGKVSPLVRYWIMDWLKARKYKGVPENGKGDLRNTPRVCPFCEEAGVHGEGAVKVGRCTATLAVHVWWRHPEMLEEEWRWIAAETPTP